MKYDFTTIWERKGKDAVSVDNLKEGAFGPDAPLDGYKPILMWIADMNFATVPTIVEAMEERIKHPLFGYFSPRDEYFSSIIQWQKRRNNVENLKPTHIGYENGVLGGVVSALNTLCSKGDKVLLHSPTYVGFTGSLKNNGYDIVHSALVPDENGIMRMDFEDMDRKLKENHIHAAIFCSPHNPCGRVWEKWEIEKAMEVYQKNNVYVISDEIWSDIILTGNKHIPTQSVSDDAKNRTIAFYAPSKTFNLAGLVGSYHIIYNDYLRERIEKESSLSHYNSMNVLSMYALIGAYKEEGYEWVDELREVITKNIDYAVDYINVHFDGVKVTKPEGTYMLFIDCEKWLKNHQMTIKELIKELWNVGVMIQSGVDFHGPNHIRMNVALPYSTLKEAFTRMDTLVFNKQR